MKGLQQTRITPFTIVLRSGTGIDTGNIRAEETRKKKRTIAVITRQIPVLRDANYPKLNSLELAAVL